MNSEIKSEIHLQWHHHSENISYRLFSYFGSAPFLLLMAIELFTCAAMETNGGKEWMDLTCDDVLPFFCQIPVIPGNIHVININQLLCKNRNMKKCTHLNLEIVL